MSRMTKPLIAAVAVLLFAAPQAPQAQPPYWTGDGGRGRSITILPPRGSGLAQAQAYLPEFVANELVANFNSFSAMTLFDRVNNQKQYEELLPGFYSDNDKAGMDLGHLSSTDYMLLGTITRTSSGFALQLTINNNNDKTTVAAYSGTVSIADLDNLTGVRRASLDLLTKMGITLTAQARTELTRAATADRVNAQTAMAQGITAQRQGEVVAPLNYFLQAAAFDPSLAEAASRSSILAANISSGNIGADARSDIEWRKQWTDRLAETKKYFNTFFTNYLKNFSVPYTLVYLTDIKQTGEIDYRNETVNLSAETVLFAQQNWIQPAQQTLRSVQTSIQTVTDGLNATGRRAAWGLNNWPQQGGFNLQPFGRQNKSFSINAELLNSRNQVIGRQTFQTGGSHELPVPLPGRSIGVSVSPDEKKTLTFSGVKAADITDSMTIRIASVNGQNAQTAARNGVLQVTPLSPDEWDFLSALEIKNGVLTGYKGNSKTIVIPDNVRGAVISIGNSAFTNKGLASVTIPNSVTSIGINAFSSNQLTSVTIPNSVTTIGRSTFQGNPLTNITIPNSVTSIWDNVFADNQLTSVTLPNSVTSIGERAFRDNQLTSVTIGANVTIGRDAFAVSNPRNNQLQSTGFERFYERNGQKEGIYTLNGRRWSYRAQ